MFRANWHLFIRIVLILGLGTTAIYVLTNTYFWLVSIWLFVFMIVAIWELARYITRTRKQVAEFIMAVSQNDFSGRRPSQAKTDVLDLAIFRLNDKLRTLRQEKEAQFLFLQTLIAHVGIAIIGYETKTGKVTVFNQAAKDLLKIAFLSQISAVSKVSNKLSEAVQKVRSNEQKLIKVVLEDNVLQLSLTARDLILEDIPYKLVSLQNIQHELEAKELESWQKLIKVLSHEIKNSAIPISTLSEVVEHIILDEGGEPIDLNLLPEDEKTDLKLGLNAISRRSKALVNFVSAYSELTRLPDPQLKEVGVEQLLSSVCELMAPQFNQRKIQLAIRSDPSHNIIADEIQIEQVLINLLKNAVEALNEVPNPSINISSVQEGSSILITVTDNGSGIDEESLEKVFIPFYTTKEQGSGIGLSLSRQIIVANKGELRIKSKPNEGTTMSLVF